MLPHTNPIANSTQIPSNKYHQNPDPEDEDHLPTSAFAIMKARPDPPMQKSRRLPGVPEIVYRLPQELYLKAQNHQNQLTNEERKLLLSRGDLIGKALAQPSSFTEFERHEVMDRPPPEIVRARIEQASNGELSTVEQLVAKATPDASGLNEAELLLMSNNFHLTTLEQRFMQGDLNEVINTPGANEAQLI